MENKICTSLEQSKKLLELGIDITTADMYYSFDYNIEEYEEDAQIIPQSELEQHFSLFPEDVPAWSLSALMELIPNWTMDKTDKINLTCNPYYHCEVCYENPIDACVEMVCWLKENGNI